MKYLIRFLCAFILLSAFVYGLSHSLLPTIHYDSFTNWNIRSKIWYFENSFVLDDAGGLVLKPHYPFLYHLIQIGAMQFVPAWSDAVANGIHFLLTVSIITAVFFQLKKNRSTDDALVTVTLIVGMPLLMLHTGGSYADITLIAFALLSAVLMMNHHLILSAVFVAACVWTKLDGLIFCLLPWLACMFFVSGSKIKPILTAIGLSVPWLLVVWWNDLSLTPHGSSDFGFSLPSLSTFHFALSSLFAGGSFGLFWYSIIGKTHLHASPTLLWAGLTFVGYIGVYLFTSNTEYLLLGQSFDRQMLLPAALLAIHLKR